MMSEEPRSVARPLATTMAVAAGALRLLSLPPNFSPVGALGLYGGARLRGWVAYVLPLAVMFASDVALRTMRGDAPFNPFVYLSFLIYVLIGRLLARTESPLWIGGAAIIGSVQFFLITNFSVWYAGEIAGQPPMYPPTFAGLMECYTAALPFYRSTLFGDLVFTALLFGIHAILTRAFFPGEQPAPVEAAETRTQ